MDLFPLGVWHYLAGGLLVGAGVASIFLTTGLRAGASSFFSSCLSWISARPGFQLRELRDSRTWRLVFALGLVGGALAFTATLGGGTAWITDVQPWRLIAGGLLVGLGTRVSRGCTSGHGISGLAAGSGASLAAVLTFMAVAIATALAVAALGVAP